MTKNTFWQDMLEYQHEDYDLGSDSKDVLKANVIELQKNLSFNMTTPGEIAGTSTQSDSPSWTKLKKVMVSTKL
jgi:hypothetical protein